MDYVGSGVFYCGVEHLAVFSVCSIFKCQTFQLIDFLLNLAYLLCKQLHSQEPKALMKVVMMSFRREPTFRISHCHGICVVPTVVYTGVFIY